MRLVTDIGPRQKRGRPTDYSPETAAEICRRIADGESLTAICKGRGMPERQTVRVWRSKYPEFNDSLQRAREDQADSLVDEALDAAREATDVGSAAVAKVKAYTMFKLAGWRNPAVYGQKVNHELTGPGGEPASVEVRHTFDERRFAELYHARTRGNGARALPAPDNGN